MLVLRPRVAELDALDEDSIARWRALPGGDLPGPSLSPEHRLRLAELLAEEWQAILVQEPLCEDEEAPLEHRPEFRPAPFHEWAQVEHEGLGCRLEWTRPVWGAEWEATLDHADPYQRLWVGVQIEAHEEQVWVFGRSCLARIGAHEIAVDYDDHDEDPIDELRALVGLTGWAMASQPSSNPYYDPPRFLVLEELACAGCGDRFETDIGFEGACPSCGERALSAAPRDE